MQEGSLQILIAMVCYMAVVIGIGIYFAKRSNQSSEDYFLGGRSLGPWVTAMSAEASDMSGWLLMGLPGVAYWPSVCAGIPPWRETPLPCRISSPTGSMKRKRSL